MSLITLEIPDNKLEFFMELVKSLDFVKIGKSNANVLTDAQVLLVELARKKAKENPENLIASEAALAQIDWDAC